jgi:signal transduction histidine kinase
MGAIDAGILAVDGHGRVRLQNEVAAGILGGRLAMLADGFGPFACQDGAGVSPSPDGSDGWQHEKTELQLVHRPDRWLEITRHVDPRDASEAIVLRDVTEARQSRGLREAFLGMLSHELRTPVTSIYAASDLLRRDAGALDDEDRLGLVEDIAVESERLLRLVDDLLVLAHSEEGLRLIREPSLLQRLVPAVVDRERRRWSAIAIDLDIGPDLPVVIGDETSVEQVVRNLISNAAKYGAGRPIVVALRASDEERGAVVRVLDRGLGVSADETESLFRPFFRAPSAAAVSSGAGVGLYVCRRLVEAMGGHMWARPREGGGAEFGFWLPEYAFDGEEPPTGLPGMDEGGMAAPAAAPSEPSEPSPADRALAPGRYRGHHATPTGSREEEP